MTPNNDYWPWGAETSDYEDDDRIEDLKADRPDCIDDDGHLWSIFAGGYEEEWGEDLYTYGPSRVCHSCGYIEEQVRGS